MTILSGRSEAKKRKKKGPRSDEQKLMDSEHGEEGEEEDDGDVTVEFNVPSGSGSGGTTAPKGPTSSWPRYEVLSNDVEHE